MKRTAALLFLALAGLAGEAALFQIDQAFISVAEGSSSGGGFSLIGGFQPNSAEIMSNSALELTGSFAVLPFELLPGDSTNQPPIILRIAADAAGAHLNFNGTPNGAYIVQSTDSLDKPWIDRAAPTDAGLGRFQFDDAIRSATRFYRIVLRR